MANPIPAAIYQRIKSALERREPVSINLVCPGTGKVERAIVTPVEVVQADE